MLAWPNDGHGGSDSQHHHRLRFGQKSRTAGRASTCRMRGEAEDAESGPTGFRGVRDDAYMTSMTRRSTIHAE